MMRPIFPRTFEQEVGGAAGVAVPAAPTAGAGGAAAPQAPALVQAAAAGSQPSAQPAPTADPGKPAEAPAAAAPYFPAGLPETLKGATERETLDKIAQHMASQPKPPASPAEYDFTPHLPAEFTASFGDLREDAGVPLWKETAHELGLDSKTAALAMTRLYDRMAKAGMIDEPVNVERELAALAPETGDATVKRTEAIKRLNGTMDQIKGLATRGELASEEANALTQSLATAAGVKAVEKLLKRAHVPGVQPGGGTPAQQQDILAKFYPTMVKTG